MQDYKVGDMVWFSYYFGQKPKLGIILHVNEGDNSKPIYDVVSPQHFQKGGWTWRDVWFVRHTEIRSVNG